ncbi:hypothetical protein [Biston robustus cypovirus]|nr:hypothetical protein [Biston robustus cypovirus]
MDKFIDTRPRGDKLFVLRPYEEFINKIRSKQAPFNFTWKDQLHMKATKEGIILYTPEPKDYNYLSNAPRQDAPQRRDIANPQQSINPEQHTMGSVQASVEANSYVRPIVIHLVLPYTDQLVLEFISAMRTEYQSFLVACTTAQTKGDYGATVINSIRNVSHTPFKRAMCFLADVLLSTLGRAEPHILQYLFDRDISLNTMIFGTSYTLANVSTYKTLKNSSLFKTAVFKVAGGDTTYTIVNKVRIFHTTAELSIIKMSDVLVSRELQSKTKWESVDSTLKHTDYEFEADNTK